MKLFFCYLICINLCSFALMGIDKKKARHNAWRISEKNLLLSALAGGSLGGILGMKVFRHKTKHRKFTWGMPIILIFQLILLFFFLYQISA